MRDKHNEAMTNQNETYHKKAIVHVKNESKNDKDIVLDKQKRGKL